MDATPTALIVGTGYTGSRLAVRWREMGLRVLGTARQTRRITALKAAGIDHLPGDLREEAFLASVRALKPAVVAYFVPPQGRDDPLSDVLAASAHGALEAFLYASSSSVYGDRGGDWVDEETPLLASDTTDTGRLLAEAAVARACAAGVPARVCRITGIYGPDRTLRRPLLSGDYTLVEGHDPWINRIHIDDLVEGFVAAWRRGQPGRTYNMVDERPHRASEFANLAADLNQLPRPAFISEASARARYDEGELRRKIASKRVRCERLRRELQLEFRYPSFLTGLPAAVAASAGS